MDALFDPAELPAPEVLRRRHLALVLIEECLAGRDAQFITYQATQPDCLAFANGSGDEYALGLHGDEALLWAFDHECPYSPYALDGARDWPGMLDGLPAQLEPYLPGGDPRGVSAAYWFVGGAWRMGTPDPGPAEWQPGAVHSDPQGVRGLIGPLLTADASELVEDYYERPDLVVAAQRVVLEPLSDDALRALEPVDGIDEIRSRVAELGLR